MEVQIGSSGNGLAAQSLEVQAHGMLAEILPAIKNAVASVTDPLAKQSNELLAIARDFAVVDQATADAASGFRKQIAFLRKAIGIAIKPFKSALDALKQAPLARERELDGPLSQLDASLNGRMQTWLNLEKEKIEAEKKRLNAVSKKETEDRILEMAEEADASGDPELAQAILDEAVTLPSAPVVVEEPKIAGTSQREVWNAEIVVLKAYVEAIAGGAVPLAGVLGIEEVENQPGVYCCKFLDKQVAVMMSEMRYPGVRVFKTNPLVRSGR